jgi:hypothetical protein
LSQTPESTGCDHVLSTLQNSASLSLAQGPPTSLFVADGVSVKLFLRTQVLSGFLRRSGPPHCPTYKRTHKGRKRYFFGFNPGMLASTIINGDGVAVSFCFGKFDTNFGEDEAPPNCSRFVLS